MPATEQNRKLVSAVSDLVSATETGDMSHQLPTDLDRDDLRDIAQGLNRMMTSLDQAFEAILVVMRGLAQGDLSQSALVTLPGRLGEVLAKR